MAEVSKVEGPSGQPESLGKKGGKSSVDADKFKKEMRHKVEAVSETNPDQQKKRKRREEAEEEELPKELTEGPATPASQVTPFSLEEKQKKISPLEMQKAGPGISPTEVGKKEKLPSPAQAFFPNPSTDEMSDNAGLLEEEAFGAAAREKVPFSQQLPPSPAFQPPTQRQPTQKRETEAVQEERPVIGPPPQKKPFPKEGEKKPLELKKEQQRRVGPVPEKEKKEISAGPMEEEAAAEKVRDTTGFFKQLGKEGGEKEGKTPEELEEEVQGIIPAPGQPVPFAGTLKEKKGEEKETPIETALGPAGSMEPSMLPPSPLAPEALPAYAHLHPQVMELFDRMVGVMTVMTMSGITETVITLNAPQFASSVFFGSQIIIQEFSTAPQAFNIQFNGTPQAVALFQGNVNDLMAAFHAKPYNFRVNRLETGYLTERPLFKRKEKAGRKEKDTGENPP